MYFGWTALSKIYLKEYNRHFMFLEEDHIFSRNDALMMIDDMIDSTHLTKFAGTFAAGRYINEDIADAGIEL